MLLCQVQMRTWGEILQYVDVVPGYNLGSIQEDRYKVEQFHFLWNSSTFYGTVPQFVEQRPKNVEQLPKKWNRSCKRVSVQQIVEQKAKMNILNL